MNIVKSAVISPSDEKKIKDLEAVCKKYDNTYNDVYLNSDLNFDHELPCWFYAYDNDILIGFVAVFAPTSIEAEITAFIHPEYRRKGVFKALFASVKETMLSYGIKRFLLVVESNSRSGNEVIKHFDGARLFNSEIRLENHNPDKAVLPEGCRVVSVTEENKLAASKLLAASFGDKRSSEEFIETGISAEDREVYMAYSNSVPVGIVNVYYKDNTAFIYGLSVSELFRRKGFGRALLTYAAQEGMKRGEYVYLDVDTTNKVAVNLYLANGFKQVSQTLYYIFTEENE